MSVMEEAVLTDTIVFADEPVDSKAFLQSEQEVWTHNLAAMRVKTEALNAFLDLLSGADAEYMDAEEYVQPHAPVETEAMVDWDAVSAALTESQQILIGVQRLLSQTLADMGVEDHEYLRVYADLDGKLRLVSEHPRQEEIETVLNSAEHEPLRNLYHAATSGMSMAGGLVGRMAVPEEVLENVRAKYGAAAC